MNDQHNRTVPYWRLSGFYLFYFASLGVLIPYWSLYLKSLSFDSIAIGALIAILPATKIFAPYAWGWVADHTSRPVTIIRLTSVLSVIAFVGVFYDNSFWWIALAMFLFSIFWNSSLPIFESNTLNHLGDDVQDYSGIRLWGSLGFIVAVVIVGEVLETSSITLVPKIILGLLLGIMLMSFFIAERKPVHHESQEPISSVIKQPVVIAFLTVCFLMLLSHGPYYTFYSIHLEDHGYSRRLIGILWGVGVIAEVVVFLLMNRLLPAIGVRKLLLITFSLTALRWLLIGAFVDSLAILLFAQLFHAFSFGVFHAVGIILIHHYFKGKHQARGQALYSSLSFGAGGAAGSLLSGIFWDQVSHDTIFISAALISLLSLFLIWKYMHTDLRQIDSV